MRKLCYILLASLALGTVSCGWGGAEVVNVDSLDLTDYGEGDEYAGGYEDEYYESDYSPESAMLQDSLANMSDSQEAEVQRIDASALRGNLRTIFNDSNHVHQAAAQKIGVKPIETLADAFNVKRPLVAVATCSDFYVDELNHSMPYLVPEASALLHEIGKRFSQKVRERSNREYRIKVTSVLRTKYSVKRLQRSNVNAVETSVHCYGTSFDISYARFIKDDGNSTELSQEDMKNILGEVLAELRNEGRCYVKFEYKQPCYHITARG